MPLLRMGSDYAAKIKNAATDDFLRTTSVASKRHRATEVNNTP